MVTRRVTYIRVYQKFGANDLNFWAVTFSTKIINFRANAVSVKMVYFRETVFRILIYKIQIKIRWDLSARQKGRVMTYKMWLITNKGTDAPKQHWERDKC